MNWKRMFVGVLTIVMVATSVAGCNKENSDKKQKEVAMGRYVEKTIELPEAVASNDEYAINMLKNPDGNIELYTHVINSKNGEYIIQYTLSSDHKWKRMVPKWLNVKGCDISVTYAPDGTKYGLISKIMPTSVNMRILKSSDNKVAEEVLSKVFKNDECNEAPISFQVLKDNSLLLGGIGICSVYKDGKKDLSFKIGGMDYTISGNKMLCLNQKEDGGMLVDVATGKTISEVPMEQSSSGIFTADKDGNWYLINNAGIHRMVKNGNSWETILDGALASMCLPSISPNTVTLGDKDDFYVLYSNANGVNELKYYVYNKDIPTTPSKTLKVVSLEENDTVRQAIGEFQHKQQDVKVDYKVLMTEEDGTTATDHIKTINTELLAGKGADILLMDGMPVNSYIEKGVLSDLSNIINPLVDKGEVLNNIIKNYTKDGKMYSVPVRYSLACAFGNNDAVRATESIQTLADYAKNSSNIPLLGEGNLSYSKLTETMFKLYSGSFLNEDGFNRDGFISFLENIKVISDQTKATKQEADRPTDYGAQLELDWNMTNSKQIYDKKSLLGIADLSYMSECYAPLIVRDKIKGSLTPVNNEFVPNGLVGINNASKQKELAAEFIKTLLCENVQKESLGDGYPVNTKALNNFGMEYDDLYWGLSDDFLVEQPSKDKLQTILDLCEQVTNPIKKDQVLLDMVVSETGSYLSGETDAESTADKIIEKSKAYLKE